jgi:hypothetical protein
MSNSAGRIGLNKIFLQDVAESRLARDLPSGQNTEWLVQTIRRLVAPVPSSDSPRPDLDRDRRRGCSTVKAAAALAWPL